VFAFDTFEGFPRIGLEDGGENPEQDVVPGGYFGGRSVEADMLIAQEAMNHDRHLRHKNRIEFIKGDVAETIPRFVAEKSDGFKIALLNLDFDLYGPTSIALEHFVPRMSRGGVILVDEYAVDTFGGETRAVDEYFQRHFGKRPRVEKFCWHSNPTGFIKVDW
jgi:hypothetical protein